jgi:DNA-binding HxlR family transcriptional regulator
MLRGDVMSSRCPTRLVLDRIADKWTTLVLITLMERKMRFNALMRVIDGISQKMLSQTLRSLERDGLVTRTAFATVPVTVEYAITPLGLTLAKVVGAVSDWAETHYSEVSEAQAVYDMRQQNAAGQVLLPPAAISAQAR